MNLLVHDDIVFNKRNFLAIFVQEAFQDRRGFQRTAELDALGGIHQFDRKDVFQIVHDTIQLGSRIGTHADMVFLSVGGNDGVATGSIAIHLILTDHRGGSILRYHETGIQTGIGNQKFGQTTQPHDKLCHTAFGDITQFGKSNTKEVIGNGKRLTVEVAAGNDTVFIREDGRIIRYGIDFCQQD